MDQTATAGTIRQEAAPTTAEASVEPLRTGHRWYWWVFYGFVWMGTLVLAAAALAHIFFHDGTLWLCWVNAFTRYVYLPAYLALAWAAWQRRWVLAIVAFAVVACHIVWMAPDFVRDRRFDLPANVAAVPDDTSPRVRVLFANVLGNNRGYDLLWQEIASNDPDIFVLAECTYFCLKSLRESPLMTPYLEQNPLSQSQRGEVVVFSKLPIKTEVQNLAASRIVRTIEVDIGPRTLTLVALHAPRPQYDPVYDYEGYWKQMVPFLTAMRGPLVIVGDFNATEHSLVYKQLCDSSLRTAHDDRGRGYAVTWPNGRLPLPPIRIDHAFLSPEIECLGAHEGLGGGSDHKPIVVDFKIRQQPPNASNAATAPR